MVAALKTTLNHYSYLSQHYEYSSSHWDKSKQDLSLISIPSILYGSSIKEGSVRLKYYISGTLVGELFDDKRNGELVQVGPVGSSGSGSVAGVVLYNEGFVLLTGSWSLNSAHPYIKYDSVTPTQVQTGSISKWTHFGYGINFSSGSVRNNDKLITEADLSSIKTTLTGNAFQATTIDNSTLSASFLLEYSGTTHIQTMTNVCSRKIW